MVIKQSYTFKYISYINVSIELANLKHSLKYYSLTIADVKIFVLVFCILCRVYLQDAKDWDKSFAYCNGQ